MSEAKDIGRRIDFGPTTLAGDVWVYLDECYPLLEPVNPWAKFTDGLRRVFRLRRDGFYKRWNESDDEYKARYWRETEEVTRFIVTACRSHTALVEALTDIVQRVDQWESAVREVIQCDPRHGMCLTKAREALATLKQEEPQP